MHFEPKDWIAIYAAVIGSINIAWSIWKHLRDERRSRTLDSQESLRELSVKHIRFRQTVSDIRHLQKHLELQIQNSDEATKCRFDEIRKLFPEFNVRYFDDKAKIERPKQTFDKIELEPMHKRIDELMAHSEHMHSQLLALQEKLEIKQNAIVPK